MERPGRPQFSFWAAGIERRDFTVGRTVLGEPNSEQFAITFSRLTEDGSPYRVNGADFGVDHLVRLVTSAATTRWEVAQKVRKRASPACAENARKVAGGG